MARYALVSDGLVSNVLLAKPGDEPAGAIACGASVGPGWSYDGETFSPPPAPAGFKRSGLTKGEFRLLFTFAERQGEAAFKRSAEAAAEAGTASNEQLLYLTMRDDFDNAGSINLTEPSTQAALDFYEAFGLLTAERKAQVLAGEPPA